MRNLIVGFLFLGLISCEKENSPNTGNLNETLVLSEPDTINIVDDVMTASIHKGFYGFIIELKGDFMPGPLPNTGTIDSVKLDLYIYDKLTFDSIQNARTEQYSWFWFVDSVKQIPIAIIKTNNKGFYEIDLPSGDYTGLVKIDEQRFYNNGGTADGHLGAMILNNNELVKQDFKIDFEASY